MHAHARKSAYGGRHAKPKPDSGLRGRHTIGGIVLAIIATFAFGAPVAQAHDGHHATEAWTPVDTNIPSGDQSPSDHSAVVDSFTAELTFVNGDAASNGGTSLETANLGLNVENGDVIKVDYELLDGADPASGSTRLFVYYNAGADTFNDVPDQFVPAPDDGSTSGTLQFAANQDGTIGTAGVVYDTSNHPDTGVGVDGTVRFTDLTVGDTKVSFLPAPRVTPEGPTFTHPVCDDPGTATFPDEEGVVYKLNHEKVEAGTYDLEHGQFAWVKAKAEEGYELKPKTKDWWKFLPLAKGCDGTDGQDGTDGEDGQDGSDGSDGQDGEDGEITIVTPTRINTGR